MSVEKKQKTALVSCHFRDRVTNVIRFKVFLNRFRNYIFKEVLLNKKHARVIRVDVCAIFLETKKLKLFLLSTTFQFLKKSCAYAKIIG